MFVNSLGLMGAGSTAPGPFFFYCLSINDRETYNTKETMISLDECLHSATQQLLAYLDTVARNGDRVLQRARLR